MRTYNLSITTSSVATNVGSQYVDIPQGGTIVGIAAISSGTLGAGPAHIITEVSRNGVNQTGITNPKGVLFQLAGTSNVNSTAFGAQGISPAMAEPVRTAERLYLNTIITGTNLTSHVSQYNLTIAY